MGLNPVDQYSLLHFASGIVVYFWGMSLTNWILLHVLFEYLENTDIGMKLINKIKLWPGGKPQADSYINSLFDNIFSILGWILAYYVDKYSTIRHLY